MEHEHSGLAELRVLGWDDDDTPLHMDYVARTLGEKLRWSESFAANPTAWRKQWADAFLLKHRHVIKTSEELARVLALLARNLRARVRTILRSEDGFGEIRKLQSAFKNGLIHDLDDDGFADMFAQTVTYGLFSLACRRTVPGEGTAFIKDDLTHYFTSPFLKEMLGIFLGIKAQKNNIDFDELGVSDVTDILTSPVTHMEVVLADFNNKTRGEDPVIHFYEHFLSAYNKQLKIQRGVFYTPQPVVSYIVRSVHELLQTEFGLEDGLADTTTWGEMIERSKRDAAANHQSEIVNHKCLLLPPLTDEPGEKRTISPDEPFDQILDPATGTATFLVEVIDVIHRTLGAKWQQQRLTDAQQRAAWNDYVPQHLLPRLHAFELMMAPYAIAHMKIGLKLAETGYRFGTEERARIYFTNALEPKVQQLPQIGFDALAHEAAAVNEIKWYKRFTVVIGNPPYSGESSNHSEWISSLIRDYHYVDGRPLGEANPRWLQDDYMKFIRLAQREITTTGSGLISMITNHAYLDNATFRGARQNLLSTYSHGWFFDLHGNTKKKERHPDGSIDVNVFEIQQGVAILILVKIDSTRTRHVEHAEIFGTREAKNEFLSRSTFSNTQWQAIEPNSPFYLFIPQNQTLFSEYQSFHKITEIMSVHSNGVVTARDHLCIVWSAEEAWNVVRNFTDMKPEEARTQFDLGDDSRDWQVRLAQTDVKKDGPSRKRVVPIYYRPFDTRWTYFTGRSRGFLCMPRGESMSHMLTGKNVALITSRMTKGETFQHVQATRSVSEAIVMSPKTSNNGFIFPLYLLPDNSESDTLAFRAHPELNFAPAFVRQLAEALKVAQTKPHGLPAGLTPEDIFHYAYAVFHSPGYRSRYAEFLKIDFPRLPLTGNLELFRALARLGGELTALHLLEFDVDRASSPQLSTPIGQYARTTFQPITDFTGSNLTVSKVGWTSDHGGTVWIDATGSKTATRSGSSGFRTIPENVWNFHIGGYQVCQKWLKDRKGRTLTQDDLVHYQKIIIALTETIRLMAEIDQVIEKHGGWPGAFSNSSESK